MRNRERTSLGDARVPPKHSHSSGAASAPFCCGSRDRSWAGSWTQKEDKKKRLRSKKLQMAWSGEMLEPQAYLRSSGAAESARPISPAPSRERIPPRGPGHGQEPPPRSAARTRI